MDVFQAVDRLAAKYPAITKRTNETKAFGKRRLATLCQVFQTAGLSKEQITQQLTEDLAGCDPDGVRHIIATTLSFWSGA